VTREDRIKFTQLGGDELGQLVDIIQKDCPDALNEVQITHCTPPL
jgi:predicted signal transduction protein with EAL and GGDEF domain